IALSPQEIATNVTSECRITFRNDSSLPLQDLQWKTIPDYGSGNILSLSENSTISFPITIAPLSAAQTLEIQVLWSAMKLDGSEAQGQSLVPLLVRSTSEVVVSGELGPSPYIVGKPVFQEEMFFGRDDVMQKIKLQLRADHHANVILLEGNRRSGKTSI